MPSSHSLFSFDWLALVPVQKMQYHPWNVWALRKQRLYGDGWGIILEIEHLFYAVNIPDTLPSSSTLCYLKRTKSSFWDTEMCCYMSGGSIVLSGHKRLWCITGTSLAPIIMLFLHTALKIFRSENGVSEKHSSSIPVFQGDILRLGS